MRFLTIVGARPQFVKAAVLSKAIQDADAGEHLIVHTGQHYDDNMSANFFYDLGLEAPKINLNIGSGTHGVQTGRILAGLEEVLLKEPSDWVVLYGDTNSTLAGALAAAKLHRPVCHIEAGVRSFDRGMPEEINRILTDRVSDLLFAPTETAVSNLRAEGVRDSQMSLVGDVMFDATRVYAKQIQDCTIVSDLGLETKEFALITVHRAENTDNPVRLAVIVKALCELAKEIPTVLPLHPRTRAALERHQELKDCMARARSLRVIAPVGYFAMSALERESRFILTDSGGVQKEAYFHGTPCLILRDTTEWPELVQIGASLLCPPTSVKAILNGARFRFDAALGIGSCFGSGDAGNRIVSALLGCDRPTISTAVA
jgi:UDP-GlcNAc3NAcA epimerase